MFRTPARSGLLAPLLLGLSVSGCGAADNWFGQQSLPEAPEIPSSIKNLSKTDIDFVMDAHLQQTKQSLQHFMSTLYLLNPDQLALSVGSTASERVGRILPDTPYRDLLFAELDSARNVEAMLLAFDPLFGGDRIFALLVGITSQMRTAYNHENEFFLPDTLNPQNIANFGMNLEIVRGRLAHDPSGQPILVLRDERVDAMRHLDQLIGQIHVFNTVLASREARTKRSIVHAATTVTLLPVAGVAP